MRHLGLSLCLCWTLVEATKAQLYGHGPSNRRPVPSPVRWNPPAYADPRIPAFPQPYAGARLPMPHYSHGLPPPAPHPNYFSPPGPPATPQHHVYWYRPRGTPFQAPFSLPRPQPIAPYPRPILHVALRASLRSTSAAADSHPGFHRRHSNTEKILPVRVYTSPLRRNPIRLRVPVETDDGFDDEFPRLETTTPDPDFDMVEPQANLSGRLPRKLVHGEGIDGDDEEASLEGGCGADLTCRTSYHCALLGGRPTFLPCSYSPKLYCCDLGLPKPVPSSSNTTVKSDPQCGWNRERTSRVIGGRNAEFGEIPWQAFVKVEGFRCGGALVSRNHVITAAHCVVGRKEGKIEVLLGELVLKHMVEELPHERRRVAQVIIHPKYENLNVDSYDVAILVLDRPVDYQANIIPICLPEADESFMGTMATVSGWGRVFADHEIRASHLQSVQVPVIGNGLCRKWLRSRRKYAEINADHICAGFEEGGRDSCRGDSGGPLTYQRNGRWYLVGIVSAGFSCGKPRQPGIYHRVSHSAEWISKHVFSS